MNALSGRMQQQVKAEEKKYRYNTLIEGLIIMSYSEKYIKNQDKHFLSLHGKLIDSLYPVSLRGSESLSEIFSYDLTCFTTDTGFPVEKLNGMSLTCKIGNRKQLYPSRFINGIITSVNCTETGDNNIICNMLIQPRLVLLTLGKKTRIWKNSSVPDIIFSVLKEYDISGIQNRLYNRYADAEYIVQYKESDYAFISRLMSEAGIYYFFEHDKNNHNMIIADGVSSHTTVSKIGLKLFTTTSDESPETVRNLNMSSQLLPGNFSLSGYDLQKVARIDVKSKILPGSGVLSDIDFDDITPLNDREQLSRKLDVMIKSAEGNKTCWHGNTGAWWLSCGERIRIDRGKGNASNYYVASVTVDTGNCLESFSGNFCSRIKLFRDNINWCPASTEPKSRIPGVLVAQVVGPEGEDVYTDKYGRIKLKFPWEDTNTHDNVSCWVRVAQGWSGTGFGCQFIPRIGSEVLVSFMHGDPNHPVVIGCVYNEKNKPPFELPGKKNISGLVTRSLKNDDHTRGNWILFDDKKDDERLSIKAQKDFLLIANNDAITDVKGRSQLTVADGKNTHIKQGDDITDISNGCLKRNVYGDMKINISNGNLELITNGGTGAIKTDRTLTVESRQSIVFRVGSNKIEISPAGIIITGTTIKTESKATLEIKGIMTTIQGEAMAKISGGIINIG
ncbi:type VI secretion system tip protein VgrG [Shigella sonnei]|nr:type VI secretion system tip protein VgrG [Shigella sonnei]